MSAVFKKLARRATKLTATKRGERMTFAEMMRWICAQIPVAESEIKALEQILLVEIARAERRGEILMIVGPLPERPKERKAKPVKFWDPWTPEEARKVGQIDLEEWLTEQARKPAA
jgi:hypothetical protein